MTRHTLCSRLAVVVLAAGAHTVAGATPDDRDARMAQELRRLLSPFGIQVGTTKSVASGRWRQLRIAWNRPGPAAVTAAERPFARALSVVGERGVSVAPARRRSFELSAGQILVVGIDGSRQLRWWNILRDPRRVRAEVVDEAGHWVRPAASEGLVSGEGLRALATLSVETPEDAALSELRVYEPQSTGVALELKAVATVDLEAAR
jgi:hypothetical protein